MNSAEDMPEVETLEQLVCDFQTGREDALSELWARLERYYQSRAARYYLRHSALCARRGVVIDDLVQVGFFALRKSAQTFDAERGTPFVAFLHFALRLEYARLLHYRTGQTDALDLAEDIDAEIIGTEGLTLADTLRDDSALNFLEIDGMLEDAEIVRREIEKMPEKPRFVILQHYFQNQTLVEIGAALGCSCENVRQIEQRAFRDLQQNPVLLELWKEYGRHLRMKAQNQLFCNNSVF